MVGPSFLSRVKQREHRDNWEDNTMQAAEIYQPGTPLVVGTHQVVINKYFSQGGFAQVYTCAISPKWKGKSIACLKRVLVPDKPSLSTLRKEVDAMRKLQGINCIVSYIDSHAARSTRNPGEYEVFVLMEYCSNKGLIDFMNTRLVDKLKEFEILNIMQSITEGVCHMHALNPPLIHRDIKIENVLISDNWTFKLCDFGSVTTPIMPAKNAVEFHAIQEDIMRNTTPQYRAPEMLDLSKHQIIGEKSDIWALGIFLYKLCYYITPFEQNPINQNMNGYHGDYAIIHGLYKIPNTPPYSSRLKHIITRLLNVDSMQRPTAVQLLSEICSMRGVPVPRIGKHHSFDYNDLKKTLTNTTVTNVSLESEKTPARPRRRPLSMYGLTTEKTADLNPMNSGIIIASLNNKSGGTNAASAATTTNTNSNSNTESTAVSAAAYDDNIDSSMDYLKMLSKSNSSGKSKRSSITSLKNLLTGGSYKEKERVSSYDFNASSLVDLQEMSPEQRQPSNGSISSNVSMIKPVVSSGIKRSTSIQRRMKNLFKNAGTDQPESAASNKPILSNYSLKTEVIAPEIPVRASKEPAKLKKAPPKPPKPTFLRTTSVANDISQFEKRFPSINPI